MHETNEGASFVCFDLDPEVVNELLRLADRVLGLMVVTVSSMSVVGRGARRALLLLLL